MDRLNIAVVGGDNRFSYLAEGMASEGHNVCLLYHDKNPAVNPKLQRSNNAAEIIPSCDAVVLPLPASPDGIHTGTPQSEQSIELSELFGLIKRGAAVFGGHLGKEIFALASGYKFELEDYLLREEFAILNAVPTAEGAISIAISETPISLFGAHCLITGYGRIAKVLEKLLSACGAKITVSARKCSDRAWAQVNGSKAVGFSGIAKLAGQYDIIFNTVPTVVIDESIIEKLKPGCLIIDLASKPGGVDLSAAKRLNIKTVWALSLPGKIAPATAGLIIKDTIFNSLTERGY